MSRTYWAAREGNKFEFLGAFKDGHVVDPKKQANAPQLGAAIIDFAGLTIEEVLKRLGDRVHLVGLPIKMKNRMVVKIPTTIEWAHIEGFLK